MKYTKYEVRNFLNDQGPPQWGMCDYSGEMHPRNELVRQMRQAGSSIEWSGLWVYWKYLDPLDEQKRPPPVKADPYPVPYPRPNPSIPEVF